jgi:hypothetical protein
MADTRSGGTIGGALRFEPAEVVVVGFHFEHRGATRPAIRVGLPPRLRDASQLARRV